MSQSFNPAVFTGFRQEEHDACGIVACLEKRKVPTRENIFRCIDALVLMNHRAGFTNGEGDGVGVHIDIPRQLWKEKLASVGSSPELVDMDNFTVGHVFVKQDDNPESIISELQQKLAELEFEVVFETDKVTEPSALGPIALKENPTFWQFACLAPTTGNELSRKLFEMILDFEQNPAVHVASLSQFICVYKVMGAGDILPKYYHDLASPLVSSTITLGHNRYSTNTLSSFFRVQPFSVLGHNGEINTIAKLRDEAKMIHVPLVRDGSDSQDLSRIIETFICRDQYTLFEAIDLLFPPIINEMKAFPKHLGDLYTYIREAWGHFAQGPAGIISRFADEAVFSVDSLGLRPLWMLETSTSYLFSSEPGIIPTDMFLNDPKPLAPGEKVGFKWNQDELRIYYMKDFQEEVYERFSERILFTDARKRLLPPHLPKINANSTFAKINNGQYKAFGWEREHVQYVEQMAEKGVEPIRSLGHDSPLAALNPERKNLADYIKESVAVVTNPAIDRDRETEHFSTRTIIGSRPALFCKQEADSVIELSTPILIEGTTGLASMETLEQPSYEQLVQFFAKNKLETTISTTFRKNETIPQALERLSLATIEAVQSGKVLIVLDDSTAHQEDSYWIDPILVTSAIDQALVAAGLRRQCSLLLRSAAIRSLHDLMISYGMGADVISPYYMFLTVMDEDPTSGKNLYSALTKGIEKVISTIGIHELRGYGRLFSAIGLHEEVAHYLYTINFLGSDSLAYNFSAIKEDSMTRAADFSNEQARIGKSFNLFPRIWKSIGEVATTGSYDSYREKIHEQELQNPIAIRHLMDIKHGTTQIFPPELVDIRVGNHDLPFVISSMSFGSQSETAFRAYAEGANRLNMVSLTGEGGELKDLLGKYPNTRGQQVASGRFGVNAEFVNSSNLLEIKIGQGAKPGEGGHLPASKVTAKIAEARNATIGSDLISPSNNHDIYSIEDLAQMVHELKTANDQAKVSVKVPVVPNIGTIAVGIAKAGADIITLSGFDGGTGAARIHAIQHVGLPVEIGVKAAHNALLEAGLRNQVELWADGGVKSALDAFKLMLLGANRIGFGTLSMIAVGCTTCRGCHLDTCHVGIATQIESEVQAKAHGIRRFVPRQFDKAVDGIVNLFTAFGNELKLLAGSIGINNLQEAVGRSDLLIQTKGLDQLNLRYLLKPIDLGTDDCANSYQESMEQVTVGAENLDSNVASLNHSREFTGVNSEQRFLGSRVSCHRVRGRLDRSYRELAPVQLSYKNSIPGNGLGAYNCEGINIEINGGAQDGIGKTSFGGNIVVLKAKGSDGKYYNGSVGKGFGYGAQKGFLVAQGNADSRAGIRLSGADMIIGGQLKKPLPAKETGNIGTNANIKGFAFEYMTNGRALVLGDPGPWICAGMTGGVVYLRQQPEMGLTVEAIQRRIAKGAKVSVFPLSGKGIQDIEELLAKYIEALKMSGQSEEACGLELLLAHPEANFVQVVPVKEQADPSVSTE